MREYYVYILANKRNGTLYVGITDDLAKRIVRHKEGRGSKGGAAVRSPQRKFGSGRWQRCTETNQAITRET